MIHQSLKISRQKVRAVNNDLLKKVREQRQLAEMERDTLIATLQMSNMEIDELARTEADLCQSLEVRV